MEKNEVKVGGMYFAKVSDKLVTVRIDSAQSKGGWHATNTATGKRIRIKNAQRLRGAVGGRAKKGEASGATKETIAKEKNAKSKGKVTAKKSKSKKDSRKQKPKRVSALAAAAQALGKADKPMRAQELIAVMAEQGLWKSPAGKTPHATLYAAMMREARDKGMGSRFRKVDRGHVVSR